MMKENLTKYFKNIWFALTGRNPFSVELDEMHEQCDKAFSHLYTLKEMYYKVLEQISESERRLNEADRKLVEKNKRLESYQVLVEQLRERLKEKDFLFRTYQAEQD